MCSHYTPVKSKSQLHDTFGVEAPVSMGKPDMWPGYEGVFIRSHPHADVGDEAVPAREAVLGHWGLVRQCPAEVLRMTAPVSSE
jgi:hypothetical protein